MTSKTKLLIVLGAFAVIGAAFGLGVLIGGDDDGGDGSGVVASDETTTTESESESTSTTVIGPETDGSTTSTTTPLTAEGDDTEIDPDLSGAAADLDAAIARASGLSYHARYEGSLEEAGVVASYVVELFRRSPDFRRDTLIESPQGALSVREYVVGGTSTVCYDQDATGSFTCQPPPRNQPITAALVAFGAIDPDAGTVTVVDGCYEIENPDGEPKVICFDDNGVPTRVDDGSLDLRATVVELEVAEEDFALPA